MKNNVLPTGRRGYVHYDHVRLKPKDQIGLHQQPTWELSLIIQGEGMRTIGDTTESFQKGDVVLVIPEMLHCWKFKSQNEDSLIENITVTFQPDLLEQASLLFPEFAENAAYLQNLDHSLKFKGGTAIQVSKVLRNMEGLSSAEQLFALLQLLASIAQSEDLEMVGRFKSSHSAADKLKEVELFVSCNFKRDISIDMVAHHLGMNRSSFCNFFKKERGMTFITYLNQYRMEHVCFLLSLPELSISEVCYQAGFNDIPYFTRLFKKMYGVSPSDYRKQLLKE